MEKMEVGGKFTALANRPEGTFFEVTDSGLVWFFNYNRPTDEEIEDMSEGHPFEIRSMVMNGVLWLFIKCDGQEWAEAPYNPHLSKFTELQPISDEDSGYGLTLALVDAANCTIRHMRLIGLGNRFSRQLYKDIMELSNKAFDQYTYDTAIARAQMIYSTPQMVRQCRNYWKLR